MSSQLKQNAVEKTADSGATEEGGLLDSMSNSWLASWLFGADAAGSGVPSASGPPGAPGTGAPSGWVKHGAVPEAVDPLAGWETSDAYTRDGGAWAEPTVAEPAQPKPAWDGGTGWVNQQTLPDGSHSTVENKGSVGLNGMDASRSNTVVTDVGTSKTTANVKADSTGVGLGLAREADRDGVRTADAFAFGMNGDGANGGYAWAAEDENGVTDTQGVTANTDGVVGYNRGMAWKGEDGKDRALGFGGALDFDRENGVEGASLGANYGVGDDTFGVNADAHYSVDTYGTKVVEDESWALGGDFGRKTGWGSWGMGGGLGWRDQDTRNFATPEEAEAHAKAVRLGVATANEDLSAEDYLEMGRGEGTGHSSDLGGHLGGKAATPMGNLGGKVKIGSHDDATIARNEGDSVTVELGKDFGAEGTGSFGVGSIAATGTLGASAVRDAKVDFDLADPNGRAAFDAFRETGEMPAEGAAGVSNVDLRDGTHKKVGVGAGLGLFGVTEQGFTEHGTGLEDGREITYDRAGYEQTQQGLGGGWMDWMRGWVSDEPMNVQSSGSESGYSELLHDVENQGTSIRQHQEFAYGDRKDNAAALKDQASRFEDRGLMGGLPERGASANKWTLDTEIDALGYEVLATKLRGEPMPAGVDWTRDESRPFTADELDAGKAFEALGPGATDAQIADALRGLASVGDDGIEAIRDNAGERNVHKYLHLEGDDTWIGMDANKRLDDRLDQLEQQGERLDGDAHYDLLDAEYTRLDALGVVPDDPEASQAALARFRETYPEVPIEYRDEEVARIEARLARLHALQ